MPEIQIKEALNKAFVKVRPERAEMDRFKANLKTLIDGIKNNPKESEEFLKNLVSDFLKNTWYAPGYFINTHKSVDLVIHNGDSTSPLGVMIEAKKPGNKEMVSHGNLNAKAMQELLLYYFRETIDENNINLKHLIITNALEWFIFDAREFYHHFSKNKTLVDRYSDFKKKSLSENITDYFYTSIASPFIDKIKNELDYTYINIADYEKIIQRDDTEEDNKLINLYKILSPEHLLKKSVKNDSNTLNDNFYFELLYIIGLKEDKEEGKKVIIRNEESKRQSASLIEETIYQLTNDVTNDEMLFDIALELNITWINRIIFLKLLEAQQLQYQNKNMDYAFLNVKTIKNFNELNILFFNVLAVEPKNRAEKDKGKFKNVPYLNSTLFEKTDNEQNWLIVSTLQNEEMDIFPSTVLKDEIGNRRKGKIKLLDYLFEFLNAYDFSSEGTEQIQEEKKTLINASVLGLIFEKINGYKDGSYFTPGFITSYICSETVKYVVINKFNEAKEWNAKNFIDIYNKINNSNDITEANNIINSIKILDPAVGSGHFLVSALNEMIAIKSELGILIDKEGKRIKGKLKILNDELYIYNETGDNFYYNCKVEENQRIQETLFMEKRCIIENCLFGVDINPNSVKICRLRLWIELLKNSYYTKESGYKELETLPNLDINIKVGDSLISRFDLDIDIFNTISNIKYTIKEYKEASDNYKNSDNKDNNKKLRDFISTIKTYYSENIKKQNSLFKEKENIENKLGDLGKLNTEFDFVTEKQIEEKNKKIAKIESEINKIQMEIDTYLNGEIYDNAFEWRLEFPEVLDLNGKFIGFDAVIGNPPYLREGRISKNIFGKYNNSPYYQGKMDIWYLFACIGINLLKENGILSFIATNNWTTATGASKLRNYIIEKTKILQLIDFGNFMVFDNASIQTMVMSFLRNITFDNYNIDYRKLEENSTISDALDLLNKRTNNRAVYLSPVIIKDNLKGKYLTFGSDDNIFNKIERNGKFLLKENEIAQGIVPNPDVVNNRNITNIPKWKIDKFKIKINDGVFVLHKNELKNISTDEKKYIKMLLEPTEIDRYIIKNSDKRILYITKQNFLNDAPNLINHLEKYKEIMENRRENINGKLKYYHLHWSRESSFFKKGEKILVVRKCSKPIFSYTEKEAYVMMAVNVIKTDRLNLKYLVGLLNSKLIAFWLKNKGKMQGNNYQLDKEPLLQLPLFNATEEQQKPIIILVDKILSAKNNNSNADISDYENKINEKIYSLYELTPEEIEIVDRGR